MSGFILLFIIFLFFTGVISHQIYRELFTPAHMSESDAEAFALLGERITFTVEKNWLATGFYQPAQTNSDRVILLIHDHAHPASQVFPLVQYFHHLGFHVLTYDNSLSRKRRTFRFGHYASEGKGCFAFFNWYQQNYGPCSYLGAVGIGFGATTLIQLHRHNINFKFLVLEQLPVSFPHYLDNKIAHILPVFWWRRLINFIILSTLNRQQGIALTEVTNLVPCEVPTLLLHAQNHPFIPSTEAYRFLSYYKNMQSFTFNKNYHNSAIYSEPERYFFLLDTFLKQFPRNF